MIDLHDFLTATDGRLCGPIAARRFADFCYDSRIAAPGQLFVAVVTETGDGHDYVLEACRAGATGVVCERLTTAVEQVRDAVTCVLVENTQQALLDYARYILRERSVEVIGVTGSVGKTSTKEAIAAVLGTTRSVFRNHANYNGRFGLPIALGKLERGQRLAVLEMALDGFDEVRDLAEITRPQVGVVTHVGHNHLQFLGTLENIAREKGRLVEALPRDGVAVLNHDNHYTRAMAQRTRARVLTYGLDAHADLYASDVTLSSQGTRLRLHWGEETVSLCIPFLGRHHVSTALAAAAVGRVYGLAWEDIIRGLAKAERLPGRTRLLEGIRGSRLLDDSYNASPASALAALETLDELAAQQGSRRLVVLGDMDQLGEYAQQAHLVVGRQCARLADLLVTQGELAHTAAQEAIRAGMPPGRVQVTYSTEDAVQFLRETVQSGDLVLLKGSALARLERVTRELLAHPELASDLLPRQSRGWQQVRLERPGRPTWVEIDLRAIAHNVRQIVDLVGPDDDDLAVVKADGYGHGAIKVARTALNNGVSWLGVACLGEALALRRVGIDAPILILGYTPAWQAREVLLNDVTATVFSEEVARALSRAAVDLGRSARVHVKVDTGMGRLGLLPKEVVAFVESIANLPCLEVEGIFTHMSSADEADLDYTRWQLERFDAVLAQLAARGILPPHVHAANSACILRVPSSHYSMVRLGIAMYGQNPSAEAPLPSSFRPALSFKCQVAQVRDLPAGSCISYGRTYRTCQPSRIAVIPVGYADGFRRAPRTWGTVLVRGQRAPIVGRVCMDQTMIDVTHISNVRQGDTVVLIGRQGDERITVDDVARRLGTINYEVVSELLARVPRMV